jgi:hypothetical protein
MSQLGPSRLRYFRLDRCQCQEYSASGRSTIDGVMPRDGSLTPRDLLSKQLEMLRVECAKCGRSGRYRAASIADKIGMDGKLTDWLAAITSGCPRRGSMADGCMRDRLLLHGSVDRHPFKVFAGQGSGPVCHRQDSPAATPSTAPRPGVAASA